MADLPPLDSPAAGQPAAVQAAFEALRQRFLAGLPARWAEISNAPDAAAQAAALHRLAGAAGGYGLPELGHAARQAERACGQPEQAPDWAELKGLLQAHGVTVP